MAKPGHHALGALLCHGEQAEFLTGNWGHTSDTDPHTSGGPFSPAAVLPTGEFVRGRQRTWPQVSVALISPGGALVPRRAQAPATAPVTWTTAQKGDRSRRTPSCGLSSLSRVQKFYGKGTVEWMPLLNVPQRVWEALGQGHLQRHQSGVPWWELVLGSKAQWLFLAKRSRKCFPSSASFLGK